MYRKEEMGNLYGTVLLTDYICEYVVQKSKFLQNPINHYETGSN